MHKVAQLDHRFIWHPFTQMRDWLKREPIVIVRGQGAVLEDIHDRRYLDGNSSIWTNLHGHNHPKINTAIRKQLRRIAHSSALGLANEPASLVAAELVRLANTPVAADVRRLTSGHPLSKSRSEPPYVGCYRTTNSPLTKVFFSDDGSTAMEVALKLAYEFSRRTGQSRRPRFLSLDGAYHGDTVGAVSLGHIDLFHKSYSGLLFPTDHVQAPYCYRCPFNRAKPERADAREYRKCNWECVGKVEQKFAKRRRRDGASYSAMVIEPLMQGAAGMIAHPEGWLARINQIVRGHGALLIADEVMTGFGRVTHHASRITHHSSLFACHAEGVQPDLMALAKGLTGGYLPMAATLTTQPIFNAFLGDYSEFKTFFHGHSFTANQLGSAAALANLEILQTRDSINARRTLDDSLREHSASLWALPNVGDIRQAGTVLAVELVKDWRTREPFDIGDRAGIRVCEAMATEGVLTRPIGNVVVLMPPYCTTAPQAQRMVAVLAKSIQNVVGGN